MSFYKMVSEFLLGRLGEHSLFPEIGSRVAVGLEVASAKLSRVAVHILADVYVAIISTGHPSSFLGTGTDHAIASGDRDEARQHKASMTVTLHGACQWEAWPR